MKETSILIICLATLLLTIVNFVLNLGQSSVEVAGVEVATTQPKT